MRKNWKKFWRQTHYWLAISIALQLVVIVGTGTLLLLKKEIAWIQPPTIRGTSEIPTISFAKILEIVQTVPEAEITDWNDIDRIDVRPDKGMLKIRANNQYEIQLDATTGTILQIAYRRSDFIETIHDGSYFHDRAKLWLFLPSAGILLILWATGIYLFILPFMARARKRRKTRAEEMPNLSPLR